MLSPAKVWAFSGKENGCWKIGQMPSGKLLDLIGFQWRQSLRPRNAFRSSVLEASPLKPTNWALFALQGSVNGGFQTVARAWSGEQVPAPHFNLNLTSVYLILPLSNLFFTSFNLCSAGNLGRRFGNHGLQTLERCHDFFSFSGNVGGGLMRVCAHIAKKKKNVVTGPSPHLMCSQASSGTQALLWAQHANPWLWLNHKQLF